MTEVVDFLSKLLNLNVQTTEFITLTSAQRARFLSWCQSNKIQIDFSKLFTPFRIGEIEVSYKNDDSSSGNDNLVLHDKSNSPKISKVGIDIQSISEMFPENASVNFKELSSIFTQYEIKFSKKSNNPKITLAGIFSLKESLIKAGAEYDDYHSLEITHTQTGQPIFYGFQVSVSHSGNYVTSIAIKN